MDRWRQALALVWLAFWALFALLVYVAMSGTASGAAWLYLSLSFLVLIVMTPLVSEYMVQRTAHEGMLRVAQRTRVSGTSGERVEVQRSGVSRPRLVASFAGGPFQVLTIGPKHEAFTPGVYTGDTASSALLILIFLLDILAGRYILVATADFSRAVPDFRFSMNPKRGQKPTRHPGLPSWFIPAPKSAAVLEGVVSHPDFFRVAPPSSKQYVEARRGRLTIAAPVLSESTMEEMIVVARVLHAIVGA